MHSRDIEDNRKLSRAQAGPNPSLASERVRIDYAQADLDYWHRVQSASLRERLRLEADPFGLGIWSKENK